ncbi:nuclear transport factor 2 family protein (plasmid) [Agrobacterium sp. rho-8.1]|nr:nuclear transport factor 2 family protein [Agrobacterium sp. rho-8.1]
MKEEIEALFDRYTREFNNAVAGQPNMDALADQYSEAFIGAAPAGVMVSKNDDDFKKSMSAGFDYQRKIGTRQMRLRGIRIHPIDGLHALATVDWTAVYEAKGETKTIDFVNDYLVRVVDGTAKVFGWITGDEQAEMKKHGIIE